MRPAPKEIGNGAAFPSERHHMTQEVFGKVVTRSPEYAVGLQRVRAVARTGLSVVLMGESGTGKEVIARAIHEASGRSGPFVALNCAALSVNLVESELFGHVRGAFSGAERDRPGALVASSRGTLFLDEIGDAPITVQVALLRALETRCVKPVGSETERPVDLRIVTATSRDLHQMQRKELFRPDLYYRLAGYELRLPPLRKRKEDLAHLATEICATLGYKRGLSSSALTCLGDYDWPGNVRELRHAIERAVAHADGTKPLQDILGFAHARRDDEECASEVRLRLTFPPELRLQARLWKESGLLLLPSGLSRRAARTWERAFVLYHLTGESSEEPTGELLPRASRLFPSGWENAESGRALKRLCELLGDANPAEVCVSAQNALERARSAA